MTHKTIRPEAWLPAKGCANGFLTEDGALRNGRQAGRDANMDFEADSFAARVRQALKDIADIARAAGGAVTDIARLTWFVTEGIDRLAHQGGAGAACRTVPGRHFPAMSVAIAGLAEVAARVRSESTAHLS
ncbi:MAG: RidA family protein [Boseongicola sp. SB0673_bin_14]|nr:RidA family protein [Boseongicola sp. SB0667_bin_21]MYI68164.1 RidA family protein [Boseongicola sp. SB0673_bin_14]